MSSEFQTRIVTDLGQTLQALDAVARRMDAIEKATKKANSAAKDHQATLSKGAGVGAAKAAQKFGGQGGAIAGQFASAGSMDGILGRVAIGAAVVGVAFRALNAVIDARVNQERQVIELTGKLRDGLAGAAKAASQQAIGGLGQADVVTKLISRGGNLKQARAIADELGVTDADAAGGLADAMLEFGKFQDGIIKAAKLAAESGQMGFSDAVSALRGDRFARRLAGDGRAGEAAARVVGAKIGDRDFTTAQLAQFSGNLNRGGIVDQFTEATGIRNQIGRSQLERVRNGEATGALREELSEAVNPAAAATLRWNKAIEENVAQLEALSKAQGAVGALFANLGLLAGGQGSFRQQANRLNISRENASRRALADREK